MAVDKIPLTTLGYGRADSADGKTFPYVFPLITTYWSQMSAMIKYLGSKEGGIDKLKGKTIVHLYHDSAYGKEPIPVLDAYAAKEGFNLVKIPIPPASGTEQGAQWAQIRQLKPDYVILWGYGVMNTVALKTARKTGFPVAKILGVWWAGSEEDVIPAGDAANNYVTMTFTPPATIPWWKKSARPSTPRARATWKTRTASAPSITCAACRRHHVRRSHAQCAGKVRQGQADHRRADALGLREPQHRRSQAQGARRLRHDAGDENLLRRP